jgi:flavin-dependent dehydrogenase
MSTYQDRFDAVIVGARAAGAATAMLLARAGMRVVVVDRGRYGSDTLSTHALMRGGVMQLHRWGLLDTIVQAGTPAIRQVTYHLDDDVTLPLPVKPQHGVDALYAPRRTILDPVLVDAARASGADVRFGVTVTDVERDGDGRVVGVKGIDRRGRPMSLGAGIVIGADGLRSVIADRVGAPIQHRGDAAAAFVYGYWSDVAVDGYEWVFRSSGTAGAIPTNDGLVCIFVATTPSRRLRDRRRMLDEILRDASPTLASLVRVGKLVGRLRAFTGPPGFLRGAWGAGWMLVGDAGYWKDPLSAHGLTDALRDAELVAAAVVAASGGATEADAMASYQATRDRLSLPLLRATDTLAAQTWDGREVGAILRAISDANGAEVDELSVLHPPAAAGPLTSLVHAGVGSADPGRRPLTTNLEPT